MKKFITASGIVLGLLIVLFIAIGSSKSQNSDIMSISEDEEGTSFVCSTKGGMQAMYSLITAYDEGGDEDIFKTAEDLLAGGNCSFKIGMLFWNDGYTLTEEQKPFAEVNSCTTVSTGQCVAIQPVFTIGEEGQIDWTGYMLTLPEVQPGQKLPEETEAMRIDKTLIYNSNLLRR